MTIKELKAKLQAAEKELAELRFQNSKLQIEMAKLRAPT